MQATQRIGSRSMSSLRQGCNFATLQVSKDLSTVELWAERRELAGVVQTLGTLLVIYWLCHGVRPDNSTKLLNFQVRLRSNKEFHTVVQKIKRRNVLPSKRNRIPSMADLEIQLGEFGQWKAFNSVVGLIPFLDKSGIGEYTS